MLRRSISLQIQSDHLKPLVVYTQTIADWSCHQPCVFAGLWQTGRLKVCSFPFFLLKTRGCCFSHLKIYSNFRLLLRQLPDTAALDNFNNNEIFWKLKFVLLIFSARYAACKLELRNLVYHKREQFSSDQLTKDAFHILQHESFNRSKLKILIFKALKNYT